MQTEVEETVRRHGAAVHSLVQRLVGRGPAAEELTCEVVLHLAAHGPRSAPRPRPAAELRPDELAAKCIALAFFGRRTYREIAGALGVAPEAVKTSIRDGLRAIWDDDPAPVDLRRFAGSAAVSGISW